MLLDKLDVNSSCTNDGSFNECVCNVHLSFWPLESFGYSIIPNVSQLNEKSCEEIPVVQPSKILCLLNSKKKEHKKSSLRIQDDRPCQKDSRVKDSFL